MPSLGYEVSLNFKVKYDFMRNSVKKFMAISLLATSPVMPAASVYAQPAVELDTVVVTGTRTERKLRDVPVRTEVITKAQLEKTHARNLVEALRYQPGILLQKIHGKSGYEIVLQGVGADRVLVLIDGKPVTPSTGSSVDLSQLGVGDVDHIEIIKGAVSALYGSSAMGGVVNIITRKAERGFAYGVTADAGSWGDKNLGDAWDLANKHLLTHVSYKGPVWESALSFNVNSSDGFDLDPDTYTTNGDQGEKIHVDAELGFSPHEAIQFTYKPAYYHEDLVKNTGVFLPGTGFVRKKKVEKVSKYSHALLYRQNLSGDARLSGYLVSENFDDKTAQDVHATKDVVEDQRHAKLSLHKAEIQYDQPLGENHLLTSGAVFFHNELDQTKDGRSETLPDLSHDNIELFFQDDIFIGDSWEVLPGVRFQDDSDFGSHTVVKLNAMYSPAWFRRAETSIRMGIGQGYRVPDLKERGYVFNHSSIGYIVLGSEVNQWEDDAQGVIDLSGAKVLDPEESFSVQFGIEILQEAAYRLDLSFYYNEIKNLIEAERYNGAEVQDLNYSVYRYANIEQARTQGFDLTYQTQLSTILGFDFSYSYLDAINELTDKTLPKRPEHQIQVGFDIAVPRWKSEFLVRTTWQSEEFTDSENTNVSPSWHAIDLKYNYQYSSGLTLFAGVDNLTDEHKDPSEAERDRRPEEGRFIYAGVKFQG